MIISNGDIWAKERSPFNIEVKADAIVLLPDPMYYSILFSDEEELEIAVGNISESKDFMKLLEFVTSNVGKTGPLRGKRVTVINFLSDQKELIHIVKRNKWLTSLKKRTWAGLPSVFCRTGT